MAPSKHKRKQHNPIHGWLDKMFGGDWMDQDEIEDRKWAALKDKTEREDQEIIFRRGAIHFVPRPKYDAQGMPIAPGPQPPQPASAHSNIVPGVYSHAGQVSAHPSQAGSRQSHATAIAQSRRLQNSYTQPVLVGSLPNTYSGRSRLSHARNNPSMTPVSGPASRNQPSSFYQPNSHQSRVAASNSQCPSGSGSSESTQNNRGSPPRPQMHATHSAPNVSGTAGSPHSQSMSLSHQTPLNHQASPQTSNRGNSHHSAQYRYQSHTLSPRPLLNESQSAPPVSNPCRSEHQSMRPSNLRTQTHPTSSSESSTEPSVYSRSIATSKAQVGNMQRTYLEGMVPMTPSDLRAEDRDDASSIAPSVWSTSIATSKAQVGNMQRTYLEGMVPRTPSDLRAELGEKERREQELAKSRNRQINGQNGRKEGGT
ncbi:hypothetical protein DL98DRAFT_651199 [Cadophora sp. DSE1049]|nr:hypothetical protein DL98DRAFT_651199 [Cadophora sp. DSE1049]